MRVVFASLLLAMVVLAACGGGGGGGSNGGGGGGGSAPQNRPPTAVGMIGAPVYATGLSVLDGSQSSDPDGDAIFYAWTLVSAPSGSRAALTNPSAVKPTIRPDIVGVYRVSLTVNDGKLPSGPMVIEFSAVENSDDSQRAGASRLSATVETSTMTSIVRWVDTFTSYRVEAKEADGAFRIVDNIVGVGDGAAFIEWRRPFVGAVSYRVTGQREDREFPLKGAHGYMILSLVPPADAQITLDQTDPVFGAVSLRLSPLPAAQYVFWLVDEDRPPIRIADPLPSRVGNPYVWRSDETPDGPHVLRAILSRQDDTFVEYTRTTSSSNAGLALFADVRERGVISEITAFATAQVGIAKVESIVAGQPLQVLTAPNACDRFCVAPAKNAYRFSYNGLAISPGEYSATIRATDNAGNTRERVIPFVVRNSPLLTLAQPSNAFVKSPLHLAGSVSVDASSLLVTAHLDGQKIFETTASTFNTMVDLPSSLNAGSYTLTVKVTDSNSRTAIEQRSLYLLPPTGAIPIPVASIEADSQIDQAVGDLILVARNNGTNYVINHAAGWEREIGQLSAAWTVIHDNAIYTTGRRTEAPCPGDQTCVFKWTASDGWSNISSADLLLGNRPTARVGLISSGPYLLWRNWALDTFPIETTFTLYNTLTQTFTSIPGAPGGYHASESFDLALAGGQPVVVFWGATGAVNSYEPARGLFKWTPAEGVTQILTLPSPEAGATVSTDGSHVAYQIGSEPILPDPLLVTYRTEVRTIVGGPPTVLTNKGEFNGFGSDDLMLKDGVLSFSERKVAFEDQSIKAWSPQRGSVTLTWAPNLRSGQDVGSGVYAYFGPYEGANRPGFYTWNGVTGTSTLRAETLPGRVHVVGSRMYFTYQGMIYRAAIN